MNNMTMPTIHVSVVSHGQCGITRQLLQDIQDHCRGLSLQVTVTLNIPETLSFDPDHFDYSVHLLRNIEPQGFSANHNAAFHHGQKNYPCQFFCVVNPDIRFSSNPFPKLLDCLEDSRVGVVAPLVLNAQGGIEDNARRFPTPLSILAKAFRKVFRPDYAIEGSTAAPDWVAGMFMLIPAEKHHRIGGFDERYFLYYEDVDLCARMRLAGYGVRLCPASRVVHEARRQSNREWWYLKRHARSALRFFTSKAFISVTWRRLTGVDT